MSVYRSRVLAFPLALSTIFFFGLVFSTYSRLGMLSVFYASIGVAVIWSFFFIWGLVFDSVYRRGLEDGRRESGK